MRILGDEPAHWHRPDGAHKMKDPRKHSGYPRRHWTSDERAYVEHLEAHEAQRVMPQEDDSEEIKRYFEWIGQQEQTIHKLRELIQALRTQRRSKKKS